MPVPSSDLADFWFLVRKTAAVLDRGGETLFRTGLGISLAQFMVLSVIDAHPGTTNQQTVADLLGLTKGTVSRQIDAAVGAGLMTSEVSAASRRDKVVRLTDEGERLVRRGDALLASSNGLNLPDIPAAEMAATLRTLAKFAGAAAAIRPSVHGI